jgi:hypothetical protein
MSYVTPGSPPDLPEVARLGGRRFTPLGVAQAVTAPGLDITPPPEPPVPTADVLRPPRVREAPSLHGAPASVDARVHGAAVELAHADDQAAHDASLR